MKSTRSKKHRRQNSKQVRHDSGVKNKKRPKNTRKLMNYRKVNQMTKTNDKKAKNKKRKKIKAKQKLNKKGKKLESCMKSKRQTESSLNTCESCVSKMMLYAAGSKKATVILKQVNKENYFYISLPKDIC